MLQIPSDVQNPDHEMVHKVSPSPSQAILGVGPSSSVSASPPVISPTSIESPSSMATPTIAELHALRVEMAKMQARLDAASPPPGYSDTSGRG